MNLNKIFENAMMVGEKMSRGESVTIEDWDRCGGHTEKAFIILDKRKVYIECCFNIDGIPATIRKYANAEPMASSPSFDIYKLTDFTKKEYLDLKFKRNTLKL